MTHLKLNVTLPVYNEVKNLEETLSTICAYCSEMAFRYEVIIVDNNSTDGSWKLADKLCAVYRQCKLLSCLNRGRGAAVRFGWASSDADILSFMDVDLSTDILCFKSLIEPIFDGKCVFTYGDRRHRHSSVVRSYRRRILSAIYHAIIGRVLKHNIQDYQCGFKAVSRTGYDAIKEELHRDDWLFDAEMLALLTSAGFEGLPIPVRWIESQSSSVDVIRDSLCALRGIFEISRRQVIRKYKS